MCRFLVDFAKSYLRPHRGNPVLGASPDPVLPATEGEPYRSPTVAAAPINTAIVAPKPERVRGVDVSKYQGTAIDWGSAARSGIQFCFARASVGHAIDATFAGNQHLCRDAGILFGGYHFLHPDEDPESQADLFLSIATGCDLPPALDLEVFHGQSKELVITRAATFLDRLRSKSGKQPLLYSYPSFWRQLGCPSDSVFSACPAWIAHYGVSSPDVPPPWKAWTFWQNSGNFGPPVPGFHGPVDQNLFNGDMAALRKLAGLSEEPTS